LTSKNSRLGVARVGAHISYGNAPGVALWRSAGASAAREIDMLSSEDATTLQAYIMGVDHTATEAEAEWGMDRLPLLVDAELRAKFMRQEVRWRTALEAAYGAKFLTRAMLDDVAAKAAAMQRAWAALAAAASEAGHRPLRPEVWETRLRDGTVVALVKSAAEISAVRAEGRHVVVYCLEDVGSVIDALPDCLQAAMQVFPGAKIQPERRRGVSYDDPIPFPFEKQDARRMELS
jgi:hypothetical protein